ncbi:General transcription and DNA repair factor IIH helicase subunit XPB1 [Sesamum angolense]|uniref:DNA 3'-5' helicase n=1 Tax=Sesamum angolense TaxID=2727404 RepID=A0AAE2BWZ2_9LAMI|nr:General transcription and DNA repair factor IIH helicase subunit XPB1 [Sesamum angolense]
MNGDKGRPSKKFKFSKEEYRASVVEDDSHFMEDLDDDQRDGEGKKRDFSKLELKPDHANRPLWACADGRIFLETFSPLYKQAYDFLIAIAEPVCRPESMHEYNLTPHSLYAAVLKRLLEDEVIGRARISPEGIHGSDGFTVGKSAGEIEGAHDELLNEAELAAAAEEKETHSFEIDPAQVENVKQRCLPNALNYPMLEEYDFRNDTVNPDLEVELKPHAQPRPYQEKSLSKMFGNGNDLPSTLLCSLPLSSFFPFLLWVVLLCVAEGGLRTRRARSGIIVLPCGAGKSLVGVSAACRIRKSCLCLATNAVSVDQWAFQFKLWSTIKEEQICRFTSDSKERFRGNAGVVVTTYNMIAFGGKRSEEAERSSKKIEETVHVVPAHMFRKVISLTKSHCKLGLTATLVREEKRITDLNFLIGPKLYEANWLDLVKGDSLRTFNVQKACEFLIRFHEQQRGDKIIVFADNLFALTEYAMKLRKPMIYGAPVSWNSVCGSNDRQALDKHYDLNYKPRHVGDNSIDIPEANVIIQISSHAGSRRQEAQRLGRILRAKGKPQDRVAGGKEEYNAFFYSLVSTDTQEINHELAPPDSGPDLSYYRLEDQLALLAKVLNAGDDAVGLEQLEEDADDIALQKARRSAGSMSAMSGAKGMVYMEYSTGQKKLQGQAKSKPKDPSKRHHLFKKRFG